MSIVDLAGVFEDPEAAGAVIRREQSDVILTIEGLNRSRLSVLEAITHSLLATCNKHTRQGAIVVVDSSKAAACECELGTECGQKNEDRRVVHFGDNLAWLDDDDDDVDESVLGEEGVYIAKAQKIVEASSEGLPFRLVVLRYKTTRPLAVYHC